MADSIDCVVIGAGVVGLAVARALALEGRDVVVLEAADAIGTETSSRNSEVIHAGIYYPAGSLKARFCVEGKHFLYAYCAERGIPHRRCGKMIVATRPGQDAYLDKLRAQALANGVDDLRLVDGAAARAIEPELACDAALLSPSTGIIDSHSLMLAYQGDAEAHGAVVAFLSPVLGGEVRNDGIDLRVGGAEPTTLRARLVVNAAGLGAQAVAGSIAGIPAARVPPLHYAKGNYFSLAGRSPFSRLVYLDIASGKETALAANLQADVESIAVSGEANRLAFNTNDAGAHTLRFLDLKTRKEVDRPGLVPGVVSGMLWRPDGSELAFAHASAKSPGDVFTYDPKANRVTRWTNGNSPKLNAQAFVDPRVIRWKSFDGR
ncbi:MAG: FAD-dependent oxidoreductase, partial [Alphaproteobacteria bacterium]